MSSEIYYFTGVAKWVKAHTPDPKYKNYSVDLFMDEANMDLYRQSGIQVTPKETPEDTTHEPKGTYVQFKRPDVKAIKGELVEFGKPELLDENNERLSPNVMIGNGSQVTVKVVVYDSRQGKGHRLESIRVDDLVEYQGGATVVNADGINAPF